MGYEEGLSMKIPLLADSQSRGESGRRSIAQLKTVFNFK
jgi:hypothetical protein